MEQLLGDEKVELSEEQEEDEFIHLVHRCHDEAEYVTSMCGVALDWVDQREGTDRPTCPACDAATRCPVCNKYRWRYQ